MEVEKPTDKAPVNIFAVDQFEAEKPRGHNIVEELTDKKNDLSVEDEAKRKLGLLSFGSFGLKPLKNPNSMSIEIE